MKLLANTFAALVLIPGLAHGQVVAGWESTGPVQYGMDVDSLEQRVGEDLMETEGREDFWCDYVFPEINGQALDVMVVGTTVVRVDVTEPGLETAKGVGVGSTLEEVMEAYPDAETSPLRYEEGEYVTVLGPDTWNPERRLIFEVVQGRVARYRIGRMPEVGWIEGCA